MLDRSLDFPDYPAPPPPFGPEEVWLCLAPHPDDEVIGCGGTFALAVAAGVKVHVVLLTSGQQALGSGGGGVDRVAESAAAAVCLGLPPPECWHLNDRELRYSPSLVQRVVDAIAQLKPHALFAPALAEPHPDHQVVALVAMAAARCSDSLKHIWFYESGAPQAANTLVCIDSVAQKKWSALAAFASQEQIHPYAAYSKSLSEVRALGLSGAQHAEAFVRLSRGDFLQHHGLAAPLGASVHRHMFGLAQADTDLPLVSVLIRSMGRACLHDALATIVCQTYPNMEVVVVNASDVEHPPVPNLQSRCLVRILSEQPAGLGVLNRSQAANEALRSAKGSLALFLDDDDLLDEHHIQRLVQALRDRPLAVAAYGGVRVIASNAELVREYDTPWEPRRLHGLNFLPIHAVLFKMAPVLSQRMTFDPEFPVLEDWDFWVQLSHCGDFVHVPGVSATYRQGQGQSQLGQADHPHHWARLHQPVLRRHFERWGVDPLVSSLAWHSLRLDIAEQQNRHLLAKLAQQAQEFQTLQSELAQRELGVQVLQDKLTQQAQDLQHIQSKLAQQERAVQHQQDKLKQEELERQRLQEIIAAREHELNHSQHLLRTLEDTRLVRWSQRLQRWLRKTRSAR